MPRKKTNHQRPSFTMSEETFRAFETWWKGKYNSRKDALNEAVRVLMADKSNIDAFERNTGNTIYDR